VKNGPLEYLLGWRRLDGLGDTQAFALKTLGYKRMEISQIPVTLFIARFLDDCRRKSQPSVWSMLYCGEALACVPGLRPECLFTCAIKSSSLALFS
jgi:hypothetical protein